jgi:hypothetical protein
MSKADPYKPKPTISIAIANACAPAFRRDHLFVGSGVIEAACKTVIAKRLKQSGMFWTLRGANAIIALRCSRLSRRFEDYWASRSRAA